MKITGRILGLSMVLTCSCLCAEPVPSSDVRTSAAASADQSLSSTDPGVRLAALRTMHSALQSGQKSTVTASHVKSLGDPDGHVQAAAARLLLEMSTEDFDPEARKELLSALTAVNPHPHVIRIAGIAGEKSALPRLRDLASGPLNTGSGRYYGSPAWTAKLALARLSEKSPTEEIVSVVKSEADAVVRVGTLFADLAYTRQAEALQVLAQGLFNEDRMPECVGIQGMPFWQYALHYLIRANSDCPVQEKYIGAYSRDELEQARKWAVGIYGIAQ